MDEKPGHEEVQEIKYHYGFYAAIHLEYEAAQVDFTFLQEYELGEQPIRLDMLIIKGNERKPLDDPIGRFFKKYNVLDYKSPEDALSIDDFYKAQGYACIYKSTGRTVNEIPIGALTVSIFRDSYPRKLFSALRETGFELKEAYPGVYHVSGPLCVPTQIIVTSRLVAAGYEAFKILSRNANEADVTQFIKDTAGSPGEYVSAILRVSMAANKELYRKLKEAGPMVDVFRELFQKELADERGAGLEQGFEQGRSKGRSEGLLSGIRSLMETMKWTASEAMTAMKIPPEERAGYAALL